MSGFESAATGNEIGIHCRGWPRELLSHTYLSDIVGASGDQA
ncbi:MAG TPA: hypothetical protein VNN77_15185 [candidate division Zixibacteria bacterium]|nr:hypothetical protein [candidate division Zixibacteria bacterium]